MGYLGSHMNTMLHFQHSQSVACLLFIFEPRHRAAMLRSWSATKMHSTAFFTQCLNAAFISHHRHMKPVLFPLHTVLPSSNKRLRPYAITLLPSNSRLAMNGCLATQHRSGLS